MDIVKTKKTSRFNTHSKYLLLVFAVLGFSGYQFAQPTSSQKVERRELLIGSVQQGDLQVTVDGFGRLRSDKQKLITSLTQATVEEMVLKPGSVVDVGSTIMVMSNPELLIQRDQAQQRLTQEKANLRQLKLNNIRDLMAEDAQLAELKADHKATHARRVAEEKLVKDGIISAITFNDTKIREQQLQERIVIQEERRAQLLLVQEEAIKIQEQQIKQEQSSCQTIQNRVDRLVVKSGMKGILQEVPVELGQSVQPGEALALIGSNDDLVALIRIPQTQAEKVEVGQVAVVDTRRDKITGKVSRIDPAVEDGTVTIEVAFSEPLPRSARPELNVDAAIHSDTLSNVFYIERPLNIAEHANTQLFKLDQDMRSAVAVQLSFGVEAGRYIEIRSGAQRGEAFILSDMKQFDQNNPITITQ